MAKKKVKDPIARVHEKMERLNLEGSDALIREELRDLVKMGWRVVLNHLRIDGKTRIVIAERFVK